MPEHDPHWASIGPLIRPRPLPLAAGARLSGIDKQPVSEPLWLGRQGLAGDQVLDRRWHGGDERALCVYPQLHYHYWQRLLPQLQLGPGAFGENLCPDSPDETQLCIGDRLRWGEALLEISQPRAPCVSLDRRHGLPGLSRSLAQCGRTGWLCRVLEEGRVAPNAPLQRLNNPFPQASLARVWRCWQAPQAERAFSQWLCRLPALAQHYRQGLRERLDSQRRLEDQGRLF